MPPLKYPVVFVSYAVKDRESPPFARVINKLKDLLRVKIGPQTDKELELLLFYDERSIGLGNEWLGTLRDAVRTAETIACFVSPTYLGRIWCGRELEIFHRRYLKHEEKQKENAKGTGHFIFPVLWELDVERGLPAKLSKFQYRTDKMPKTYLEFGLRRLADLSKYRDDYKLVLENLTDAIRDTVKGKLRLPEEPGLHDFNAIPSAFDERTVAYDALLLTDAEDAWTAAQGVPSLQDVLVTVGGDMKMAIVSLEPNACTAPGYKTISADRKILLAIARSDGPTKNKRRWTSLNSAEMENLALIVVDTNAATGQAAPPDAWIAQFREAGFKQALDANRAVSCAPVELAATIERLVTRVKLAMINSAPKSKAADEGLALLARSDGIPIDAAAILTGPGREVGL